MMKSSNSMVSRLRHATRKARDCLNGFYRRSHLTASPCQGPTKPFTGRGRRGQVHVFGQRFPRKTRRLSRKMVHPADPYPGALRDEKRGYAAGFTRHNSDVQWQVRKRPPEAVAVGGLTRRWRIGDLDIPHRVASQQSPQVRFSRMNPKNGPDPGLCSSPEARGPNPCQINHLRQ